MMRATATLFILCNCVFMLALIQILTTIYYNYSMYAHHGNEYVLTKCLICQEHREKRGPHYVLQLIRKRVSEDIQPFTEDLFHRMRGYVYRSPI